MIAPFKIMGQNDTNFSMAVHNRDGRVVYKVVREGERAELSNSLSNAA